MLIFLLRIKINLVKLFSLFFCWFPLLYFQTMIPLPLGTILAPPEMRGDNELWLKQ